MPELPEVETVARQLAPRLGGRMIHSMEIFDPLLRFERVEDVSGRRIGEVRRIGKQIGIELEAGRGRPAEWLAIHLRMTGRLHWRPVADAPPPGPPLRARWRLEDGILLFNDVRRFGTIRVYEGEAEARGEGIDPMSAAFTASALATLLRDTRTELKPWLLRQDRLVGVGNIYASEILFRARLHPRRTGGSLNVDEIRRLHRAIRHVLRQAIRWNGTTFSDFQDSSGSIGNYGRFLSVYLRENTPCSTCRIPIQRIVQQQRGTFFCPGCQRESIGKGNGRGSRRVRRQLK